MIAFLSLLVHVVVSPFKTKARLEAEIVLLRPSLKCCAGAFPRTRKLVVAESTAFRLALSACFRGVEPP